VEVVERHLEEVLEILDGALEHLGRGGVAGLPARLLLEVVRPVVELVEEVPELVGDLREDLLLHEDRRAVVRSPCGRARRERPELLVAFGAGKFAG
jgi:hypothetical protein